MAPLPPIEEELKKIIDDAVEEALHVANERHSAETASLQSTITDMNATLQVDIDSAVSQALIHERVTQRKLLIIENRTVKHGYPHSRFRNSGFSTGNRYRTRSGCQALLTRRPYRFVVT
jgi:hypothetical protein